MAIHWYTPAGYENGKGRFPVLYLLHGMGGGHSFQISLNYPKTFDYVGLFSAGLGIQDTNADMIAPEFYKDTYDKLDNLFANHPKLYYIANGETPGGHIWRNWRIYLNDFAQKIFK